jgi:hypothetical protein
MVFSSAEIELPMLLLVNLPSASPRPIRSLTDIPGLERLDELCDRFKVTITAHGSMLRHLVARLSPCPSQSPAPDHVVLTPKEPFDLFDLVPFTSDIDLFHSGDDSLTESLRAALLNTIPFAECFRWQLISAEQNRQRMESLRCSAIVPANLLTLTTESLTGIYDPWKGLADIQNKAYRFIRNGFYKDSPLYRGNRDLELFSALHYFRILLQSNITDFFSQPGFFDSQAVIADAINRMDTAARLQTSAYLRVRLRYLMCSLFCATTSDLQLSSLLTHARLQDFITQFSQTTPGFLSSWLTRFFSEDVEPTSVLVSNWLGGDRFRCKDRITIAWSPMSSAASILQIAGIEPDVFTAHELNEPPLMLAEHHVPLFCSEDLSAAFGTSMCAPSSEPHGQGDGRQDEMVHVAVKMTDPLVGDRLSSISDCDMTCLLIVRDLASKQVTVVPVPTVVHFGPRMWTKAQWLYLRLNCFGVLQTLADYASTQNNGDYKMPAIQLLLVSWAYTELQSPRPAGTDLSQEQLP